MEKKIVKFGNYDYEITRASILNLQVCSNCPLEEIEKLEDAVKTHSPAGTANNWMIIKEGNLAPVKCLEDNNRQHYMFEC